MQQVMENLKQQRDEVRETHRRMLQYHHESFHKVPKPQLAVSLLNV